MLIMTWPDKTLNMTWTKYQINALSFFLPLPPKPSSTTPTKHSNIDNHHHLVTSSESSRSVSAFILCASCSHQEFHIVWKQTWSWSLWWRESSIKFTKVPSLSKITTSGWRKKRWIKIAKLFYAINKKLSYKIFPNITKATTFYRCPQSIKYFNIIVIFKPERGCKTSDLTPQWREREAMAEVEAVFNNHHHLHQIGLFEKYVYCPMNTCWGKGKLRWRALAKGKILPTWQRGLVSGLPVRRPGIEI